MSKIDLYQSVTDRIVAALEAGAPPWFCPWGRGPGLSAPVNLGSGRPYQGINVLLLNLQAMSRGFALNRWLTYRQAQALGAQVRCGEQGTTVVFFKMLEVQGHAYYRVVLHELTHWSGHATRCNRPLQGRQHIEAYAFEELVAEIGSAFLCGHCGLPGSLQHASYVQDWLRALRNDRRLIFTAAALAQKASDYLLTGLAQPDAAMALHTQEAA